MSQLDCLDEKLLPGWNDITVIESLKVIYNSVRMYMAQADATVIPPADYHLQSLHRDQMLAYEVYPFNQPIRSKPIGTEGKLKAALDHTRHPTPIRA